MKHQYLEIIFYDNNDILSGKRDFKIFIMKFSNFSSILGIALGSPLAENACNGNGMTATCRSVCLEIQSDLRQPHYQHKWSVLDGQFGTIYQKKCGPRRNVYDLEFCTQSCELEIGDACNPNPTAGEDICAIGLKCNEETNTCEDAYAKSSRFSESSYSSSSSSSDSSDYFNDFLEDLQHEVEAEIEAEIRAEENRHPSRRKNPLLRH